MPQDELRDHFECNAKDYHTVEPRLEEIYSSSGTGKYPLGIKLWLIPKMNIVTKLYNPYQTQEAQESQGKI